MCPILTEGRHTGEFLMSEQPGTQSRETGVITGGKFPSGTVLGQVTADSKYTEHDPNAGDGTENAVAILYSAVDATAADIEGVVIARGAEVAGYALTWVTGITQPQIDAATANLLSVSGINIRNTK